MTPSRPSTALRLEALEDRTLLDGKVTALIVNGRLLVTGDDLPNGFTVERAADAAGTTGFRITPDATTAINDQPAGVPVDVGDALDLRIDARGGDDSVSVTGGGLGGGPHVRLLSVESGSGADYIKLTDVLVSNLALSNNKGSDQLELSRMVAGGGGAGGSVAIRCPDGSCAVSIADSTVLGPLSVVSRGGATFSAARSSFADVTLSLDGRAATPLSSSSSFDACTAGTVRVSSRGGGHQFSMTDSRCVSLHLKHEGTLGVATSSSTTLDRCAVDIEIMSWSWGTTNGITVRDTTAGRLVDKSSPLLLKSSSSLYLVGGRFGAVSVSSTGGYDLKAEGTALSSLACAVVCPPGQTSSTTLTGVQVDGAARVSVQGSHAFSMTDSAASNVFVKIDRLYAVQGSASVDVSRCVVSDQLSVWSRGAADVSVDACRSTDYFLKIDGIKGESTRSSVSLTGSTMGDVSVRCTAPLDVTASSSSMTTVSLDLTAPTAPTPMTVTLEDCFVSSFASITGRNASYDLAVAKRCVVGDLFIKLDRGSATAPSSTVHIDDSSVMGQLSVSSRGSLDATVNACRATDIFLKLDGIKGESSRSNLQLGSLAVEDCVVVSRAPVDVTASSSSFDSFSSDLSCPDPTARMSIKLEECLISSYSMTGRSAGYDLKLNKRCVVGDLSVRLSKGSATAEDSTVSVDDCDITGRLSVESLGGADISLSNALCGDTFIKFVAIKGERSMASLSSTNVIHRDLAVRATCPVDVSAEGSSFSSIDADVRVAAGSTTLSPRLRLGSVAVAGGVSVRSAGAAVDFSFGASQLGSLTCRVDAPAGSSSSVAIGDLDCDGLLDIAARGQTAVFALACTAGEVSVKLDRVSSSQQPSSATLTDVDVTGALSVSSRGSSNLSVARCETSHLRIKVEAVTGDTGRSQVSVVDNDCDGTVEVWSNTGTDFTGEQVRAADMFLKIESLRASPPASTVSLTDCTFSGGLSLTCGGGADRTTLSRVSVVDRVLFAGGLGADELSLDACILQGQTVFDGGTGSDTLTATADCLFGSPLAVVGFEKVSGLPTP